MSHRKFWVHPSTFHITLAAAVVGAGVSDALEEHAQPHTEIETHADQVILVQAMGISASSTLPGRTSIVLIEPGAQMFEPKALPPVVLNLAALAPETGHCVPRTRKT